MKNNQKNELRIYIDDINRIKIGDFISQEYSVRKIGLENGVPIFRELKVNLDCGLERDLGSPDLCLDIYKQHVLRTLSWVEDYIKDIKEALNKPYILESEINPPIE